MAKYRKVRGNFDFSGQQRGESHVELVSSRYGPQSKSVSETSNGPAISDHDRPRNHVVADLLRHGGHNGLVSCLCRRPFGAVGHRDVRHRNGL